MSAQARLRRRAPLAAVFTFTACASPIGTGWRSYERGDFDAALRTWLPQAEAGDADAQFFVAVMYDEGTGVSEDDFEAVLDAMPDDDMRRRVRGLAVAELTTVPEQTAIAMSSGQLMVSTTTSTSLPSQYGLGRESRSGCSCG